MPKIIKKVTALDRTGKVLGDVRLHAAVNGKSIVDIEADNGETKVILKFFKANGKWFNEWSPAHCTNSERIDIAVNYLYATPEHRQFLIDRSNYPKDALPE